jgi:hypothetical protein
MKMVATCRKLAEIRVSMPFPCLAPMEKKLFSVATEIMVAQEIPIFLLPIG